MRRAVVPIAAVLLLALVCGACGASARTKALRVNLVALNVARDTVLAVSKEREAQIVERAATKEEGRAQLDAWRQVVDEVAAALEVGYRAIYAASILDDARSAGEAGAAVQKALALVKDMKNPPAPPSPKETKP